MFSYFYDIDSILEIILSFFIIAGLSISTSILICKIMEAFDENTKQ